MRSCVQARGVIGQTKSIFKDKRKSHVSVVDKTDETKQKLKKWKISKENEIEALQIKLMQVRNKGRENATKTV